MCPVPEYTAVPVDTQDVFAGKLDVAVGIQLKRMCLRI